VVPQLEAAWLFKIAHNVCLSRRRSAWRRGRIESPADFEVIEDLAPAPARRGEELIGLQDVLERLPDNQRRAILLREWQGLSYREIAAELELSQAAVETLIFRARRSLATRSRAATAEEAPPRRGARLSNLLAGLKTALIGGGVATKVAATVAVVGATAVIAADPLQHQRIRWQPCRRRPPPCSNCSHPADPQELSHREASGLAAGTGRTGVVGCLAGGRPLAQGCPARCLGVGRGFFCCGWGCAGQAGQGLETQCSQDGREGGQQAEHARASAGTAGREERASRAAPIRRLPVEPQPGRCPRRKRRPRTAARAGLKRVRPRLREA
jgi:hypothetical protein